MLDIKSRKFAFYGTVSFFTLFFVGVLVFFTLAEREISQSHNAIARLEKSRMLIAQTVTFIEKDLVKTGIYTEEIKGAGNSLERLRKISINNNSRSLFGEKSTSQVFMDPNWRLDENILHIIKAAASYSKKPNKTILPDIISARDQSMILTEPVITNLKSRIRNLKSWVKAGILISILGFTTIFTMMYRFFYLPWKEEFSELTLERKRLELLVDKAEAKGETFFWEMDVTTKEVTRSKYLSGLLEIDIDEVGTEYLYDEVALFDDQFKENFTNIIQKCIEKKGSFEIDISLTTKNKKHHWLSYHGEFVHGVKGDKVVATIQDISALKLAEKRFQSIFNSEKRPYIIIGESEIWDCNEAAIKILGYENREDLLKLHPAVLSPMYQVDGSSSFVKLKETTKEVNNSAVGYQEWVFRKADGSEYQSDLEILPLKFEDRDLFLLSMSENADRKDFERRLVQANRKAMEARREKMETLNEVALKIHQAAKALDGVKSGKSSLEKIQHNLFLLWSDLGLNRTESDNTSLIFNLYKEIEEWKNYFEVEAKDKGITFRFQKDKESEKSYWGDFNKIVNVLRTIIENIIDTTNGNEINLTLSSEVHSPGKRQYYFIVQDFGDAISQNDFENLLNNENGKYKKALEDVENLQADLKLSVSEGVGSTFSFSIVLEEVIHQSISGNHLYLVDSSGEHIDNGQTAKESFSVTDIWSHFGGDWGTIQTVISDFVEYYPGCVEEMKKSIRENNGDKLELEASSLYGVLTYFPFHKSLERTISLQKMGEYANFDGASAQVMLLEEDLKDLENALKGFIPKQKSAA